MRFIRNMAKNIIKGSFFMYIAATINSMSTVSKKAIIKRNVIFIKIKEMKVFSLFSCVYHRFIGNGEVCCGNRKEQLIYY